MAGRDLWLFLLLFGTMWVVGRRDGMEGGTGGLRGWGGMRDVNQ